MRSHYSSVLMWPAVCGCSVCGCGCMVCADALCACVACGLSVVCLRGRGDEKGGARGAGPPLLWVCVGGGVLLSHTLAGAVPSALAVLASGFGKGKSGRVPAAMAAATLAGPDPARPGAGVGFGYRIADTGRLAPPPGGLPAPQKKGKGVCWVGRPISAGRLHSLAGRPPPVYQPRRLRGAFPHA